MSKCGPVNSQSSRASSDVPIHRPLRVPTINSVRSAMSSASLGHCAPGATFF